ncbi:MAG: hypothetical protein KDE46_03915, partial [Caldilineaceae bacterium]|nr:hypothetical protein [Caldilineaceae bacterium]
LAEQQSWLYLLAIIGLGKYHFLRGSYEESRLYMQQAKALADQRQDLINMLAMRVNLGALTFTTSLLWDEASQYYGEALTLAERLGNIRETARSQLNLGVLRGWQAPTDGIQLLSTALENAQTHAIHDIETTCQGYLAAIALYLDDISLAYSHLTAAQQLLTQFQLDYLQPFINQLWASYYLHKKRHTEALSWVELAIQVAQQKKMAQEEGIALRVRGQIYAEIEQPLKAQADFEASLNLLSTNPFERARVHLAWASSLPATSANAAAHHNIQAARAAFQAVHAHRLVQQIDALLQQDSGSKEPQ